MELFEAARLKIGNNILAKKYSRLKRKVSYRGFENLRTIGIVWDCSVASDFQVISRFHQKMQEKNIDLKVIGYFPGKDLPNQYTAIRYLLCLRRKELSFFYLPVSDEAEKFLKTPFSILIDMNFENRLPLRYITHLSAAPFKVGLFSGEKESSVYDLMMEMKKPVKVEMYLDQIIHYLERINS